VFIVEHSNISKHNSEKKEIEILGNTSSCLHGYNRRQIPVKSTYKISNHERLINWSLQEMILSVKVKFTPVSNFVSCPFKIQCKPSFCCINSKARKPLWPLRGPHVLQHGTWSFYAHHFCTI